MAGATRSKTLPGAGPFGFFDPFNLVPENADEALMYREAELAHGRVSMMVSAAHENSLTCFAHLHCTHIDAPRFAARV